MTSVEFARSSRRLRRLRRARGYTVIEVMMAIALLAIASTGVLALHSVSAIGNMRSRDLAVGTELADTWVERLRADAAVWTLPSPSYPNQVSNLANTQWLSLVQTTPNVWFRPKDVPNRGAGAFDLLGNDVFAGSAQTAVYCTNVRLNWLYPPSLGGTAVTGTPLIRAEVRVFWLREGGDGPIKGYGPPDAAFCDPNQTDWSAFDTNITTNTPLSHYHFVYVTATIAENVAP